MIRTSEMVSEGHPDKVADYLADSVLDYCLERDPNSRVACEVLIKDNHVIFAGEITSNIEHIPLREIAEKSIKKIGFTGEFALGSLHITDLIGKQSPDIALGVDKAADGGSTGAGDQGMMFGYACNDTPELLPMPYILARDILIRLKDIRSLSDIVYLGPDAKSQVSVNYGEKGEVLNVAGIVVSTQHSRSCKIDDLRRHVHNSAIIPALKARGVELATNAPIFINATGAFHVGGPVGDCGVTGRKIVVDSYGGFSPVGGGCFSGKDPTKVDRSAAYFARKVACDALRKYDLQEITIEVAYSIGVAKPIAINVRTKPSSEDKTVTEFANVHDWTPEGIISRLGLRRPVYRNITNYGHFVENPLY